MRRWGWMVLAGALLGAGVCAPVNGGIPAFRVHLVPAVAPVGDVPSPAASPPALTQTHEPQPREMGALDKNVARRLPRRVAARGIYVTAYTAARPERWAELLDVMERSGLNAIVLDVKSDWGSVQYDTANPHVLAAGAADGTIRDIRSLLLELRRRRVYPIARVVTFKDNYAPRRWPEMAVQRKEGGLWTDYRGLTWLNPCNRAAWDYVIGIAAEVASLGFAEIQFDYVRFPSDGPMSQAVYPGADGRTRERVIGEFLRYARQRLEPLGVWVSADIFGIMLSVRDDQGIGQLLEEVAAGPHILSPMLYPSHYAPGNLGLQDPNASPYETVYRSLQDARRRLGQSGPILRPWLQDFSWGRSYGPREVAAQIQAALDHGLEEWLLWNADNVYTVEHTPLQIPSGPRQPPEEP